MEHAWFSVYDTAMRRVSGKPFKAQINPESCAVSASNKHEIKREGASVRQQPIYFTFLEREPETLSMELLFDTYRYGVPEAVLGDVRASYAQLRDWLAVSSEEHAPPVLLFAWGSIGFVGVLTQIEETFTMFASAGMPVRAKVRVSMQGCMQAELQSRALHSPDRTKLRTASRRETLWAMAAREYGSPALWRPIALANDVRSPRKLGKFLEGLDVPQLVIPPLPEEE